MPMQGTNSELTQHSMVSATKAKQKQPLRMNQRPGCFAVNINRSTYTAGIGLMLSLWFYYIWMYLPDDYYWDLLQEETAITARPAASVLPPVAVLEEWKRHHSLEAIHANPHNRSYIVASYSCPRQFGVQAYGFLSGFLQAVISNRTFLYYYGNIGDWTRRGDNARTVCDQILQRQPWLPEYYSIAKQYNLPKKFQMTMPKNMYDPKNKSHFFEQVDRGNLFDTKALLKHQVLEPARWSRTSSETQIFEGLLLLTNPYAAKFISSAYDLGNDLHNNPRVLQLYSQGISFLYGLLFYQLFNFTKPYTSTMEFHQRIPTPQEISIAIHSRHIGPKDDGADVGKEVSCLDSVLDHFLHKEKRRSSPWSPRQEKRPCSIYIMSDRPATLQNVAKAARQRNCQVIQTQHTQNISNKDNPVSEHGPFAGAGYFRDLLVVSQARSAYISFRRSSSALVDELIEYHRHLEAWNRYGIVLNEPLVRCILMAGRVAKPRKSHKLFRKLLKTLKQNLNL